MSSSTSIEIKIIIYYTWLRQAKYHVSLIAKSICYKYVVNQESTDLIREAHMGDASFSLNGNGLSQDLFYFQSPSLD